MKPFSLQFSEGRPREIRLVAWVLFALMMLGTLFLWKRSIEYISERRRRASEEDSLWAVDRLSSFFEMRLESLRRISQFYLYTEDLGVPVVGGEEVSRMELRRRDFEGFSQELLDEVPGFLAVIVTDRDGIPKWIAPHDRLPMETVTVMASDPVLMRAFRSLPSGPVVSEPIPLIGHGDGFAIVLPLAHGHRIVGYVVGLLPYQGLFDSLPQPEGPRNFNLRIAHGNRLVYPLVPVSSAVPLTPDPGVPIQPVFMGGWRVAIQPAISLHASPLNPVSLAVLGAGCILSFGLSYLIYRWLLRAAQLQSEARESRSRLEHTGLSLIEAHSQLELIINSVDEGVVLYDAARKPVMANAAFLAMFDMGDQPRLMASAPAHHEHMVEALGSESRYWSLFEALQRWPGQQYTDELTPPARGGKKPRTFTRRGMNEAGGDRGATIVVYKDITRDKAIDRAKDEFLSNVTHELRSPLASIKGFAEMMRRDPQMQAGRRDEFVSIICEEAERLQQLVEELLDLRRLEDQGMAFNPTTFDLKLLVEELVADARAILVSKNLVISVEWNGLSDHRMQGDVTQLRRAVRNLIVNSAKYSPQSGRIKVIGHSGRERLTLDVHDQGSGIDERDLPHIFEKFYRGRRQGKQKGTGLGLAIVKHIVERHGGHIGVRSELGEGTAFRIELPRQLVVQPAAEAAGGDEGAKIEQPKGATDANA